MADGYPKKSLGSNRTASTHARLFLGGSRAAGRHPRISSGGGPWAAGFVVERRAGFVQQSCRSNRMSNSPSFRACRGISLTPAGGADEPGEIPRQTQNDVLFYLIACARLLKRPSQRLKASGQRVGDARQLGVRASQNRALFALSFNRPTCL